MDRFEAIVQLVRNKAILKAQQEMCRKASAASCRTWMASIMPSYPEGKEYDAYMDSVADAAENRLVQFLLDISDGSP